MDSFGEDPTGPIIRFNTQLAPKSGAETMKKNPILRISIASLVPILALAGAIPLASAYGQETWQTGFAGTAVVPSTGFGFGFWGWCAFKGTTSGSDGDCQISQYIHSPSFSVKCEASVSITGWTQAPGFTGFTDFIITSDTIVVNPSSATGPCLAAFGLFLIGDTGIPAIPNHYNFNGLTAPGGITFTELQIQVTQIP